MIDVIRCKFLGEINSRQPQRTFNSRLVTLLTVRISLCICTKCLIGYHEHVLAGWHRVDSGSDLPFPSICFGGPESADGQSRTVTASRGEGDAVDRRGLIWW